MELSLGQPTTEVRLFRCSVPRCGKLFGRKEHLTRHLKSHSPNPQHECPICRRRYARSDVLKRHIENHPQNPNPRQPRLPPCSRCLERRSRCDGGSPCHACVRSSSECVRHTPGVVPAASCENEGQGEDGNATTPDLDLMTTGTTTGTTAGTMTTGAAADASQDAWLGAGPDSPWTHPVLSDAVMADTTPVTAYSTTLTAGSEASIGFDMHHLPFDMLAGVPSSPELGSGLLPPLPAAAAAAAAAAAPPTPPAPAAPTVEALVQSYFTVVHPLWPIVHQPTFRIDTCSPLLLRSMILLASLVLGLEHEHSAPAVLSSVFTCQLFCDENAVPIQTLQAVLLCIVYCISCENGSAMHFRASCLLGYLVAACRRQQILNGLQPETPAQPDALEAWVAEEERNRLAYACLRLDAYLSILLDHPPLIHRYELNIPLPKLPALWEATAADERSQLQWSTPAGREKELFCDIVGGAFDGRWRCFPLAATDFHLGLCAFQGGIWAAARESQSSSMDALTSSSSSSQQQQQQQQQQQPLVEAWRGRLGCWSSAMEARWLRQRYFSQTPTEGQDQTEEAEDGRNGPPPPDHGLTPLTLLLLYTSSLKMHAPIPVVQSLASLSSGVAPVCLRNAELSISGAARSGVRLACWLAAQIGRVVDRETAATAPRSRRLLLRAVGSHCLFTAAIVVASYAHSILACVGHEGRRVADLFVLDESDSLQDWVQNGNDTTFYAVWGPGRIPLCRCQFDNLVASLRAALSVDAALEKAFAIYAERLKSS